jgi:hypothetical protein
LTLSAAAGEELLGQRRRNLLIRYIVAALALLLGAEIARLTIAFEVAEARPELAYRLAPASPASLAALAMSGVGEAAANASDPTPETIEQLRQLAAAAPLEPEPFLVEGALAVRAGEYDRAEQLLHFALLRAPRSAAARYLMAQVAVSKHDLLGGLRQMAILTRLLPGSAVQVVPALAEFARTPGAEKELAVVLAENPHLKRPLLTALSADPENADLVVALAGHDVRLTDSETQAWKTRLIRGFIARGDYDRAYALWRLFAGLGEGIRPLLFNGSFETLAAPPPFNWDFSSSSAGIAEPANRRLRVLYYGRTDTALASQLLLLSAGTYRFEAPSYGRVAADSLSWTIECVGGGGQLAEVGLSDSATPPATFTVPSSGCPAQWLALRGSSKDIQQPADVQIGPASIERIGG